MWGGNGGGQGGNTKHDNREWSKEFAFLASMPCKTSEERQIRDRRAFLLHSLFVDISVVKAVSAIQSMVKKNTNEKCVERHVGDFRITVTKDEPDPSSKLNVRIDRSHDPEISSEKLVQRNLLKGITADESATVHVRID